MRNLSLGRQKAGAVLALFVCVSSHAHSQQLIANGNFEAGTFAGWKLVNQLNPSDIGNNDHFYLSTPGVNTPPVNGVCFPTAPNPAGGNFYAVSASDFPGAHAILQDFIVPSNANSVTLSFQLFANDQSGVGPAIDTSGLDYLTGGVTDPLTGSPLDNQHARVDVLRKGTGDLSTAPSDVIAKFYIGVDNPGGTTPNPYSTYTFDLTTIVAAGQTYRLRFAEVDNLSALNIGVDNVNLFATPSAVPEPGPLALLLGAATVFGGWRLQQVRRRAER